jgi:hypothetical protein
MKITKSYLKDVVKECLLEILQDGLVETQRMQESRRGQHTGLGNRPISTSSPRPVPTRRQAPPPQPAPVKFTGPMADIFEDTARTTLVEQMNAGDPMSHRPSLQNQAMPQVEQIRGNPEDIFGDAAVERWESLAFMGPPGQS